MKNLFLFMLILVFSGFSCKNKSIEIHDHEGEEVKLFLTEYSDQFEVFAEADPFIAGEASNIFAHFTKLTDFKPVSESSITISLIVGTKGIRQTIKEPVKQGIYNFVLKPETAGKGKIIFDIKNKSGEYQITINNIEVFSDEHTAFHEAEKMIKNSVNSINFTKEQSWKIEFETTKVLNQAFGQIIKTTAQVIHSQDEEILITSKTHGIIDFTTDLFKGIQVADGELLATIQGNDFADNNSTVRFIEAENNFELLKSNMERANKLITDKIISEKEFNQTKTDYENAKTVYENIKKNFNEKGQLILSTTSGNINKVFVKNGEYAEPGKLLFSVISNKRVLLKADVSQKHFQALKEIQSANIQIPGNNNIFSLRELDGKLVSFGQSVDISEAYLLPVIFRIENNGAFLPGSFVNLFIRSGSGNTTLIVPNSALIEELGNFFVLVQQTPEIFEKRQVIIGSTDGLNTEIISGIKNDERIVSKGAIIVKLAAVSNSLDPHAGHVH